MKKEQIEEFEEEFEEEQEMTNMDEIEELSAEESDETEGGLFIRAKRCKGTVTRTSRSGMEFLPVGLYGITFVTKVTKVSGPNIRWIIPGTGSLTIFRTQSKLGTGRYKAYGLSGDWVEITITWK